MRNSLHQPGTLRRIALGMTLVVLGGSIADGFIDLHRPESFGSTCERSTSITVLKVEKFNKEKGVIIFQRVKDLKGELPRSAIREHLSSAHHPQERERYLNWVGEGKTAVVFRYENRVAICIGDQWSVCDTAPSKDPDEPWTIHTRSEPMFLKSYCGDAEKLPTLVADVLAGKAVTVPCMLGDRDSELRERTGKIVELKASLSRKP